MKDFLEQLSVNKKKKLAGEFWGSISSKRI
jgi:hypothetical protein